MEKEHGHSERVADGTEAPEPDFAALVEDLDAIVWQADPYTFRFRFVSRRGVELFGYARSEWYRPDFWRERLIHPEDAERTTAICRRAVDEGRDHELLYRAVTAAGDTVWLRDRIRVVKADGVPQCLRGVMIDVTEQKRVEDQLAQERRQIEALTHEQEATLEALRISEERLRLLEQHTPQVFWISRPDGTPLYVSTGYERIWGRPIRSFEDWAETLHPEDRARTIAAIRSRGGRSSASEYRIRRPDGSERWILDRGFPIREPDGSIERVVGIAEDITERKLASDRLEAAEAHYRRLVATSPYGVYVLDPEGRIVELNAAAEQILQRPSADLIGQHFAAVVPHDWLAYAQDALQQILSGEAERFEMEFPVQRPSGELRMLAVAAAPIASGEQTIGVHGIARDITNERARDEQRRLLVAALANLPDAVSIIDREGRILYANPAHAALLRYDPQHLPSNVAALLPDAAASAQMREIQHALRTTGRWSGRVRRLRGDGSVLTASILVFSVSDEGRETVFSVARDASEEIAREQHLRRVERLASLGTLIGGVAHELNNPLTAVVGFAHLMLMDERPSEDRDTLQTMAREAERAAKIVADLRVVARSTQQEEALERGPVDLNDVVRHVAKVRRYSLETRTVRLVEQLAEDLPRVEGNRGQLEQVVLNLVVNAEQALDRVTDRPRELVLRTRAAPVSVTLAVIDNGPGIPREHLDRIFDPFFTTKSPGEGTGLGLSLVHSIVEDHGGSMRVESEPGAGAEFVLDLPAHDPSGRRSQAAPPAGSDAGIPAPLRVLVVDDEAAVRTVLARLLRKRGHAVTEAAEGQEALRLIEERGSDFDIIVSDLRMPGLGGDQLLARLRRTHPELAERVLFITGDPASMHAGYARIDGDVPVLMKPFRLEDVAALVESRASGQDSSTSSG